MTALRGQTLGKMLLRIQVVDADGNVPPWPRAVARELLRGVISNGPCFPWDCCMCGFPWTAASAASHDYLSGSYVVRKQRSPTRPSNRGF